MDKPIPCPFCSAQNVTVYDRYTNHYSVNGFFVGCGNMDCLAEGPFDLSKSGAIAKWNTRAALATPRETCHRLGPDDGPDSQEDA